MHLKGQPRDVNISMERRFPSEDMGREPPARGALLHRDAVRGHAALRDEQELLRARGTVAEDFDQMDYQSGRSNLSEVPDEVLFSLQRSAYRRFFLDPRRIARAVARHPDRSSLLYYGVSSLVSKIRPHPATHSAFADAPAPVPAAVAATRATPAWDASEPVRRPTRKPKRPVRLPVVEP